MNTIYIDSPISDDVRRQRLFEGQIFVYSPSQVALPSANSQGR